MRRFSLPVTALVLLLVALVVGVAFVPGVGAEEAHCDRWDSDARTAEECETTGRATQIGFDNFEPTMGVTPDGGLYMATTPDLGVALGWQAGVARTPDLETAFTDGGWDDVQPQIAGYSNPPETNDPYAYVDSATGRIFSFHMSPILLCSILSFSDDGGETWTTPPVGCGPSGAWDHQTMVAAPPTEGTIMTGEYPNVLVQCVNSVYAEMCARSLDGGLTWGVGYPAYPNPNLSGCGTQTGHLEADRDGILYLPTPHCGNRASVYVSSDSGLTWTESVINDEQMPFTDPAIGVDAAGNLHATWIDNNHRLQYAVSEDKAATWSAPVAVTPPGIHAELPALVAGDEGHVAIAFAGTKDLPGGYGNAPEHTDQVTWGAYLAVTEDAVDGTPTFTTVNATGDDPIQRGVSCASRCLYLVDFIDVVLTPDGTPVGAFSDGCDDAACIAGASGNNVEDRGEGMIAVVDVDLCADTCHQFAPAETAGGSAPSFAAPIGSIGAVDYSGHVGYQARDVLGDARHRALLQRHLDELGFEPAS